MTIFYSKIEQSTEAESGMKRKTQVVKHIRKVLE